METTQATGESIKISVLPW